MTLIIVLTILVSSGMPLMYPICFVSSLIIYNLNKFALFRQKPEVIKTPTLSLLAKSMNWILLACIFHLVFGLFAIFDSTFRYDSWVELKDIILEEFSISKDERQIQFWMYVYGSAAILIMIIAVMVQNSCNNASEPKKNLDKTALDLLSADALRDLHCRAQFELQNFKNIF